jgi:hypothetical protein
MSNTGKPERARSSQDRPPGGSGYRIEKSPVEARQGFRGKPVLYVLIASLALLITAFIAIGTMIWVR